MPLDAGRRLGPYEIVAPLGAGGMGEVYRAKDPRLGREVAIKVLPAALAHDADRLRRFELEARSASALNHANLLTVFELGEVDERPYLVTELLEGRSLRAVLAQGEPLPVRTAAQWGAQIARGLAAAHGRGIVHRDLKPENLFVCADGRVKILDFGLAKLSLGEGATLADAPTVAGATQTGVVLGTAGYMAPEQVRGEHVDSRADIFSLGCVLYELFGGRRAFGGDTAIESLHAILKEEPPPLDGLRAELPPAYARLVERCLDKSAANRFQHAADLAWALESGAASGSLPGATSASGVGAPPAAPPRDTSRRARAGLAAALALVAALGGYAAARWLGSRPPSTPFWSGERLLGGSLLAYAPRPSPDGSLLAFIVLDEFGQSQVALLRPGEARYTLLTRDRARGPAVSLAWSPDGRLLYFDRAVAGSVHSVPALGGEERLVLEDALMPVALADGSLVAIRSTPAGGRQLVRVAPGEVAARAFGPEFASVSAPGPEGILAAFPDGREVVFFGQRRDAAGRRSPGLWAVDVASGAARDLAPTLEFPRAGESFALPAVAVDPRNDDVVVAVARGDLHVVTAVPRAGGAPPRALLHLTASPLFLAVDRDGSLLVDQVEVFGSLLRFAPAGGSVHRLARFSGLPHRSTAPLELPDGGVLFTGVEGGANRLQVVRSGAAPAPFVEIESETSGPVCRLNAEHLAFFVGPTAQREIAIASLDGRIVRRLPVPAAGRPTAFAALDEGRALLFGAAGRLFAVDTATGAARDLGEAAAGTVDPASGELLVRRSGTAGPRFVHATLDGTERASYAPGAELYAEPLNGDSIDARGRLLVTLGAPETWWVGPGVVELGARTARAVPLEFRGDVFSPSWGRDGSILAIGWEYSMNLWRFRAEATAAERAAPR